MRKILAHSMMMILAGIAALPVAVAAQPVPAPVPQPAAPSSPAAPPVLADSRGLSCTADDRSIRQIVIDFTHGRWRDAGGEWRKIAAQDDATITLVRQGDGMLGGLLSDTRRIERLDRATLILSTQLHAGLIDQNRSYRCEVVPPFDAKLRI